MSERYYFDAPGPAEMPALGAQCSHGSLARSCERCADERELAALRVANEMRQVTIADLRDRLRVFAPMVCEGCGCAPRGLTSKLCWDCDSARLSCVLDGWSHWPEHYAACISVGLRALCGRRILEGC